MSSPIGVLDSGLGGLSVVEEIKKLLPKETILYFADSKNTPYSKKSDKEIYKLSKRIIEFLLEKDAKIIVIACNTITVVALERLRKDFPHIAIIGTVPVIKTAVKLSKNGKIGVFSTVKTAKSRYQNELIEKFGGDKDVLNLGSDLLVPVIEQGRSVKPVLVKELLPFKKAGIDTLALGCTHYPLVKTDIEQIMGPGVMVIDSGGAVARQVKRVLQQTKLVSSLQNSIEDQFFTSGNVDQVKQVLNKLGLFGDIITV